MPSPVFSITQLYFLTSLFFATAYAKRLYLFEKIIAFVIYKNKRREIFHFDFPNSFHSEFGIFEALHFLNAVLRQYGRQPVLRYYPDKNRRAYGRHRLPAGCGCPWRS